MSSKILWQVTQALRGSPMPRQDIATLAVQLLVWARVGKKEWVTNTVPSLSEAADSGLRLLDAGVAALERANGTLGEAFAGIQRRAELAGPSFQVAANICIRLEQDGLLEGLDFNELIASLGAEVGPELAMYHSSMVDLMVRLVGPTAGTTTYCPWDQIAQASSSVFRAGGGAAVESPLITPFPALAAVFSGKEGRAAYSDPIRSPSFIESGKLECFDQSVALPPLGVKVRDDLVDRDLFGRFDNPKATWTVLCIQHLMAHSRRRVVVAVPYSLLIGIGADKKLREQLLRAGQVRAVISLFPGLASGTAIQLAILVLDPRGGTKQVRFVNASGDFFKIQHARSKVALGNPDGLLEAVESRSDSDLARSVEIGEIEANDFSLQVERYVLDEGRVELQRRLSQLKTVALGDLVATVRTPPASKADAAGIPVLEVGASDIGRTGYTYPGREGAVRNVGSQDSEYFLREGDIVVTIRGSVGRVGIIPADVSKPGAGGWTAGSSLTVLRARSESRFDPAVLALLLRSPLGQELLSGISSGVTIPMITLRDLLQLELPVPGTEVSRKARAILDEEEALGRKIVEMVKKQQNVAGSDSAYGLLD